MSRKLGGWVGREYGGWGWFLFDIVAVILLSLVLGYLVSLAWG